MTTPTTISPPILLVLDPGASSGYSIIKIVRHGFGSDSGLAHVVAYGHFDVDTSSPFLGDWALDFEHKINALADQFEITEMAIEAYYASSRAKSGTEVNFAYRTAAHMWARRRKIHYEILSISLWKLFVAGRVMPTKAQKIKWGAEAAKKNMIILALSERHGIRLPNHSLSSITHKPIEFKCDTSDAVGQGIYAAFLRYQVRAFASLVDVPTDIIFKSSRKTRFSYNDIPTESDCKSIKQTRKREPKIKITPPSQLRKPRTSKTTIPASSE